MTLASHSPRIRRWAGVLAILEVLAWGALVWYTLQHSGEGASEWGFLTYLLATIAVGWLLAARVPDNPIGWLLLAIPGFFLAAVPASLLGHALLTTNPGIAQWLLWYSPESDEVAWVWLPPIGLMFTQLLLLFPDGRLPSPGWRPFQRFALVVLVCGSAALSMIEAEVAPGVANPIGWISQENTALVLLVFAPLLASLRSHTPWPRPS